MVRSGFLHIDSGAKGAPPAQNPNLKLRASYRGLAALCSAIASHYFQRQKRIGARLRHPSLFFRIRDLRRHDFSIEGERCLVEIVERHGRAEIAADVEAVVCGEGKSGGDRHPALRYDLTIDP